MNTQTAKNPQTEPQHLWNKSYVLVLFLGVFTGMASQMVTPLISKYAVSIGAPLTIAATISSMMSIAALLCRPFSGASNGYFQPENADDYIHTCNGVQRGVLCAVE